MASFNEKVPVPLPTMGVRKDVHPLSLPQEALAEGVNVLVNEGALKPRAAHEVMPWQSLEGWRLFWSTASGQGITAICEGAAGVVFYATANGKIGYTTDFFATDPTEYNCPGGGYGTHLFYNGTSLRWQLVTSACKVYCTTPGSEPHSAAGWGAPVLDLEQTGTPYTIYDVIKEPKYDWLLLLTRADSEIAEWVVYYASVGQSWALTDETSYGKVPAPSIGWGAEGGETYFLAQLNDGPGAAWPNSVRSLEAKNCETQTWTQEALSSGYSSFVGDSDTYTQTIAVWRSGGNSKIVRSTNLGTTWADEVDAGGDPDGFRRVFFDAQAGSAGRTVLGPWTDANPDGWPVNSWWAACTEHPLSLWVDGVLATEIYPFVPSANHDWSYNLGYGGRVYLYCTHGDPDTNHTTPGVEVPGSGAGSVGAYLAVGSLCYQSIDGQDWIEFSPTPFLPSSITCAIAYQGQWYVAANGGLWMAPTIPAAFQASPQSVHQLDTGAAEDQIVAATHEGWMALDASTGVWTDITDPLDPLTGARRKSRTVFRAFTDGSKKWLLGTNGVDTPKAWESDLTTYRAFTGSGLPSYAKAMCISANRVILANGPGAAGAAGYGINCSSALDFDSGWDGLGLTLLADTQGEITAMLEISPLQFTVFKTDAIYHGISQAEFAGGIAAPFRYELVKPKIIGPPAPHCVLQTHRGEQLFLGLDGGVYLYDGFNVQDIGKHVRQIIEGQADFDNIEDSWGMVDDIKRLAYFFFPTTGGRMNRGVIIDLDSGSAWELKLPQSWNAACGRPMFVTTGITWDEVTLAWDDMNVSWDSLSVSDFRVFMALESDTWFRQRWDAADYTDAGWPIYVTWKPGWSLLSDMDRFATFIEMKHIMSELYPGQEFVCTALGMDDEMVTDTQVWNRGGMGFGSEGASIGGSNLPNQYTSEDTLTTESEGYTTEFMLSAQRFTYKMDAAITKRFRWHGGVARFKARGLR